MKNTIGWLWIAGLAAVIACIAAGCPATMNIVHKCPPAAVYHYPDDTYRSVP